MHSYFVYTYAYIWSANEFEPLLPVELCFLSAWSDRHNDSSFSFWFFVFSSCFFIRSCYSSNDNSKCSRQYYFQCLWNRFRRNIDSRFNRLIRSGFLTLIIILKNESLKLYFKTIYLFHKFYASKIWFLTFALQEHIFFPEFFDWFCHLNVYTKRKNVGNFEIITPRAIAYATQTQVWASDTAHMGISMFFQVCRYIWRILRRSSPYTNVQICVRQRCRTWLLEKQWKVGAT